MRAIDNMKWSVLEDVVNGNEKAVFGFKFYPVERPFLNWFLKRDPPAKLCARIFDKILDHLGEEPFGVAGGPHVSLPIHIAADHCHHMTPSVFATLLSLTSTVGLRQKDQDGFVPLQRLSNNRSTNIADLENLYQQALSDHSAFGVRYHPLKVRASRYAVLASLARLRNKLYARQAKRARITYDEAVEDEVEEEEEEEQEQAGVLNGALSFDVIHSDDLWRHILDFV